MKINPNLMLRIFSLIFSLLFVNCGKEDNTTEDSISSSNPNSSTEYESKNGPAKTEKNHTSLEAIREREKNRLKAEEAFYSNFGKKNFECPKSGLEFIRLFDDYNENVFWISSHEISRGIFLNLMNKEANSKGDYNIPITNISVKEMQAFCQKLTDLWHKSRPIKIPDIYKFDLPTEKEWEIASCGEKTVNELDSNKANFNGSFPTRKSKIRGPNLKMLVPVKEYSPNELGIYNIWGNAKEIYYSSYYNRKSTSRYWRINGGSYLSKGNALNDEESYNKPAEDLGFRIVLAWVGPGPSPLDEEE